MAQDTPPFTAKGFLKTFSIIHLALLAGPVLFMVVSYAQHTNNTFSLELGENMFAYLLPGLTVASVFVGNMLFKKNMKELNTTETLQSKLAIYQTSSIIRYALLEGTALLAIVTFSNENNLYYLIFAVIPLGYLLLLRPTKDKITTDLNLTAQEVRQFDN